MLNANLIKSHGLGNALCYQCRILVEKIDSNGDGKITEDELKSYVDHTQKRYIYEDVDRQWKDLNPDGKPSLSWGEYVNRTYGFDVGKQTYP